MADRYLRTIAAASERIREFPGRTRVDYLQEGMRSRTAGGHYLILYEIHDETILILRVVHQASDYESWFE